MLVAWVPTILILLFFLFLAWMQSDAADPSGAPDNEDNDTNGSNSRKTSIAGRYQNNFNLSDLLSFFVISSSSKVPESRHRGRRGQDALHPGGALPRRRRTRLLLRHRDHGNQPSHDLIDIGHNLHSPGLQRFSFPPSKVDSGVIYDHDVNVTANINSSRPDVFDGVADGISFSPGKSDLLQARLTVSVPCLLFLPSAALTEVRGRGTTSRPARHSIP